MRILFADSLDESRLARMRDAGHECVVEPGLGADDLPDRIGAFDVLVVRSTKVTAKTIETADRLGLIVRAGAGTDTIDVEAATALGVYVCNVPGQNAIAVAELTMALLLAIDRHIAEGVADLRAGHWDKARYTKADGIAGRRLAIVGLGDIGLAVAERAVAFGMRVSALDRPDRSAATRARIEAAGIRLVEDRTALLRDTDVVSIHVPRAADTAGLVDRAFLDLLPDGAIVLNTSRGDVVDEEALLDALERRGMRAGLDVWQGEPASSPATFDSRLARHPSVVGSHHIGASTAQAQAAVADGTVAVVEAYTQGRVLNCVNLESEAIGEGCLAVRHLDRVGVLAAVFAVLRGNGLNVSRVTNEVFAGGVAAVATINVGGPVTADLVDELSGIDEVLGVTVTAVAQR